MWVAKIKFSGEKGKIGSRTKKFGVSLSGFPVSFYTRNDGIYIYMVGFIFGEQKKKKKFIKDIKKEKGILHFENKGDFIIAQIVESLRLKPMYNHKILNLEPVFIDEEGWNHWTIGSWNKKELIEFINIIEKRYGGNLIGVGQKEITNFSILSIQPELTAKQKRAMELAIKENYYNCPRKVELRDLAKIMRISYSTFQAHLRKAEQKLMPFFFNKTK
ncbi:MAG: helix-turn-helix domain-containing protein [Nanoarchaeota archaeon]|nr:helix-turn-helix domain-containing protein [Nanoarchaeota archaeon]